MVAQLPDAMKTAGDKVKITLALSEQDACNRIDKLAEIIMRHCHFAQDEAGRLYVFSHGVYMPNGEERVRRLVKEIMFFCNRGMEWSSHKGTEVVECIRLGAPRLWPVPPLRIINLLNGLFDLDTTQLKPHDPRHLSNIQMAVTYCAEAECPR